MSDEMQTINKDEARALIARAQAQKAAQAEATKRAEEARRRVELVLAELGVEILPDVHIRGGEVMAGLVFVARPKPQNGREAS